MASVRNPHANPLLWQMKIDRRPPAGFAGYLDRALVQFDQPLGQRQSEADAVVFAVEPAIDLPEWRQRDRYLFGRHPYTRIRHPEGQAPLGFPRDSQEHLTPSRGDLDGVGQKIDEDLRQLGRIAQYIRQEILSLDDEIDLGLAGQLLNDSGA